MAEALKPQRWLVRAWVTAPGEFPSQSLEKLEVDAVTVPGAVAKAKLKLEETWIAPVVVAVVRVQPPFDQRPGAG